VMLCCDFSDEESSASLLASPRHGATVGRDLHAALTAVEANLQQLLLNSSAGAAHSANVCSRSLTDYQVSS